MRMRAGDEEARDVRVCAVGDSFVAGVGDPEHLGWAGRLAAGSHRDGLPLTFYNLGIRRDTTRDVLSRWRRELPPRLKVSGDGPVDARVVVSVGVNDTTAVPGGHGPSSRVGAAASAAHLEMLLGELSDLGWGLFVAGPPPVADAGQNTRIADLDTRFAEVCARAEVTYAPVFAALAADPTWTSEVAAGDGAHPAAAGYARLAELVRPVWRTWLGR
ncbi:lysophospholipase L1-like esterase [Pseudonocardia sediminis]|uniref:Lysophospholipase L1-like esterase n=1 Tax=Pseudonocardia sediminis TaxID=1397368 RepID=A0A4Q7V0N5_PSEST|nr:GDSL-type esterase/lipase family protein [Pseudonocardia sediminis]RZT88017.1 lysophospholipase L1-like esterase [Pseudonocardia sediminis]